MSKLKIAHSEKVPVDKNYLKHLQSIKDLFLDDSPLPNAIQLERAILGAVMIDTSAFNKISILKSFHFYDHTHQIVHKAFVEMNAKKIPIDLLTTTEHLLKTRTKGSSKNALEEIGGNYSLVELTNNVASGANIEYHATIIYQKHLERDSFKKCMTFLKKFKEGTHDVFDIRNDLADGLRVLPPKGLFELEDFDTAITKGEEAPELLQMVGTLWNRTEVAILFGPTGCGKSIFSVQIADALSRGVDVIPNILPNHCPPQRVLYIDFELTNRNIKDRYTNIDTGERWSFNNDNLKRGSINADFLDFEDSLDKIAQEQIEHLILLHKAEVLIVDNITFLTSESSSDADVAKRIMKKLVFYKLKYNLSVLVIGHTPKISKYLPLEAEHLSGSSNIQIFCDAFFGMKPSTMDSKMKYLKQFKDRSEEMVLESDNVMSLEIGKIGAGNTFLALQYINHCDEKEHFVTDQQDEYSLTELLEEACNLKIKKNIGYRKLAKEIGWRQSSQSLMNKMKKFATDSLDYELTEKGLLTHTELYNSKNKTNAKISN